MWLIRKLIERFDPCRYVGHDEETERDEFVGRNNAGPTVDLEGTRQRCRRCKKVLSDWKFQMFMNKKHTGSLITKGE